MLHQLGFWRAAGVVALSLLAMLPSARACPFDQDGVAGQSFTSDALLLLRYAQGVRGAALVSNTLASDANAVSAGIESAVSRLDIDGVEGFTTKDAMIAARFISGLRRGALTAGLELSAGARNLAEIESYIAADCPATNAEPLTQVVLNATQASTGGMVTFGLPMKAGALPAGITLVAKTDAGSTVPLQLDAKTRYADGSLKHGIVTIGTGTLAIGEHRVDLFAVPTTAPAPSVSASALLASNFEVEVKAVIAGVDYYAAAKPLLAANQSQRWLAGALVTEWLVDSPLLRKSDNATHPHLHARFFIRATAGTAPRARVDVILENVWTYEPNPSNFTYENIAIWVAGASVWSKANMVHRAHTRWRQVVRYGNYPTINVYHDPAYVIGTRAVPNYDHANITPSATAIAQYDANFTADEMANPTGVGGIEGYMPATGGRPDIGLLPGWAVLDLLGRDDRARRVHFGIAERGGNWSVHYRDKRTGRPVTIDDYPYLGLYGVPGDKINPATGLSEALPDCVDCATPYADDSAHQPSFAYLPYLLSGDYYFLEELQFWAARNLIEPNPGYRDWSAGLQKWGQVRGQAWALRSFAQAVWATPDADPLKAYFTQKLDNNIQWYLSEYVLPASPGANVFAMIANGYAIVYDSGRGAAPWQDDFFTSAIGHAFELGISAAAPLLEWKATAPVQRMVAPGYCWIDGAIYTLMLRDSETSPFYASYGEAYAKSVDPAIAATPCASAAMASALGLQVGEMTGYSSYAMGFPSNMQPALAMAVDSSAANSATAWQRFMSRTVKPDYSTDPQFAIVPRTP